MSKKHKKNRSINTVGSKEENSVEYGNIENAIEGIDGEVPQDLSEKNVIQTENSHIEAEPLTFGESDGSGKTNNDENEDGGIARETIENTATDNADNMENIESTEENSDNKENIGAEVSHHLTEESVIQTENSHIETEPLTFEESEGGEKTNNEETEAGGIAKETIENSETDEADKKENESSEDDSEEKAEKEREELERAKAEKEKIKKEKREKRKAWIKAHKLFIAICCVVLIVIIGVLTGHFASTANMVFIHNGEDLQKASEQSKKTELKLKSDVVYEGDLVLSNCNLDLDKYTLKINGNLTIKSKNLSIGKQKFLWSGYEKGGKLEVSGRLVLDVKETKLYCATLADNIIILGDNAEILNDVDAETKDFANVWFNRNESTDSVLGSFSSDTGNLNINAQTNSNVFVGPNSTLTLNGNVREINGGEKVYLKNGSRCSYVSECLKLYISETAVWGGFDGNSVKNYYFVQKLAIPELLIEKTDKGFELHISHVDNADAYIVIYEGLDKVRVAKETNANYTTFILPERAPLSYKLSVYAVSDNFDEFNDGDAVNTVVDVYATLDKPKIISCNKVIDESGERYILTIENVANALTYDIKVNGKTLQETNNGKETVEVDLTSVIVGVGTYNIRVTARAEGTNYKGSEIELYSFVNTIKLVMGDISESEVEGKFVYTWDKIEGATAYEIVYGENQSLITTDNSITLESNSLLKIRPLGKGYYKDGDFVSLNAPEEDSEDNPLENENSSNEQE